MNKVTKTAFAALMACTMAGSALAQESDFVAADWEYGPRYDVEGEIEIWNTAKQKMLAGEHVIGGTVRTSDSRTYCAMANSGAWDFIWVEMQHDQTSWESLASMYRECPDAAAVPGVRLAYTSEREVQRAVDAGAMVIVFPTIDSVEEAEEAISWVMFPPVGRHSAGGGQFSEFYSDVPGGYRASFNDNVVVFLMIETLEGVEDVEEIAALDGFDGLFIASGDLGNFSGYQQGDPEYEELVDRIFAAGQANGKAVCGPLAWRTEREGFTCFQGPADLSLLRNGSIAARDASEPQ